ncbi:hypothetical protein DRO51_01455 [Candidatus Bathyarchaeota archaeon]|nr:MAG: hypothetical protein DRO51_01455 [Candidatus Bathyarchaeota archaeon]
MQPKGLTVETHARYADQSKLVTVNQKPYATQRISMNNHFPHGNQTVCENQISYEHHKYRGSH